MKKCSKCGEVKALTEFGIDSAMRDGFRSYCKVCHNKRAAKYREQNPDKIIESRKKTRAKHPNGMREYHQKIRETKPWQHRIHGWKSQGINITYDIYCEMLILQEYKCKICGSVFNKTPCVDHCHETGKVRGILCNSCNVGLSRFKDNLDYLNSAIKYLKDNIT